MAKIILAGGSGFVGEALARELMRAGGWEIVVLTRDPTVCHILYDKPALVRAVKWDGKTMTAGGKDADWVRELDGADALVNFTGRSVNCVHTAENKRAILESRVDSVRVLGEALAKCAQPPKVWVQCSAVGYYGNRGLPPCDETAAAGNTFLADVCRRWENAFAEARPQKVRPVVLRLATVLGREGGALPPLAKVARLGLGGRAGDGRQGLSWIHLADLTAIFRRAIDDAAMRGTFNACAPEPVSNQEFMKTLRGVVRRPWSPPAPAMILKAVAPLVMHTDASLILEGQFCVPTALEKAGFEFRFSELKSALANLLVK
ncbi:TIGR01777 family oxidoreductase [Oleiharenicola lentus]|uniref:TIGR01777 family oxidoreductase n=1 Tax=Oleiharenicola lentus TaxID=2508720 RepID=UPI003F675150